MIQTRLTPGAVAHWRGRYAVVLEATGVLALVAPVWTMDQIRCQRDGKGMDLARDALDRGDLPLEREMIGLNSSGDDLVIRCGACRPVPTASLIPFWQSTDSLLRDVLRMRARVAESIEAERMPAGVIRSTMTVAEIGSRGRRIGRAGLS